MEYSIVSWQRASSLRRNENFYSLAVKVNFQVYFEPLFCETIGTMDICLLKGLVVWCSVELGLGLGFSLRRNENFCSLAVEVYFHTVFKPLFCETIGMLDISIVLFNSHFFVPFLLFFILFSSVLFVSQIFFTLHHFYLLSVIVCPFLSPFEVIVCFLLLTQI